MCRFKSLTEHAFMFSRSLNIFSGLFRNLPWSLVSVKLGSEMKNNFQQSREKQNWVSRIITKSDSYVRPTNDRVSLCIRAVYPEFLGA